VNRVAKEASLITLESDKATMENSSSDAGVVKELRVKVGDKVSQGSVIALLGLRVPWRRRRAGPAAPAAPAPTAPKISAAADAKAYVGAADMTCDVLVLGSVRRLFGGVPRRRLGLNSILVER